MDTIYSGLNHDNYSTNKLDSALIDSIYEYEKDLANLISMGNIDGIVDLYKRKKHISFLLFDSSTDYLRFIKNSLIVLNTVCNVSAKKGGLPNLYVYSIFKKYSLIIEKATSEIFLKKTVMSFMLIDYASAVYNYSTINYSPFTKSIVKYIHQNLSENMSVKEISSIFHMHPSSLCRKFKAETKFSVIEYINIHKIKLAQNYFENGNNNITEVSSLVGFKEYTYFSKIFKKHTNLSPREYIKQLSKSNVII